MNNPERSQLFVSGTPIAGRNGMRFPLKYGGSFITGVTQHPTSGTLQLVTADIRGYRETGRTDRDDDNSVEVE